MANLPSWSTHVMECDFNLNRRPKRIYSSNNSSCLKLKTLVKSREMVWCSQTTMMSRKSRTDMIRLAVLLTIISYVHDHLTYSPNPTLFFRKEIHHLCFRVGGWWWWQ